MAAMGPIRRYRRWRRISKTRAPRPWMDGVTTFGVTLLVIGAVLIAIYVARLH